MHYRKQFVSPTAKTKAVEPRPCPQCGRQMTVSYVCQWHGRQERRKK